MSTFNEEDQSRPRIKMHQKRKPQRQVPANSPDSSNQFNITFNEEDQSPRPKLKSHQKRILQRQVAGNEDDLPDKFIPTLLNFLKKNRAEIIPFIMSSILLSMITNILSSIFGSVFGLVIMIIVLTICFVAFLIFQFNSKLGKSLIFHLRNSKTFIPRRVSDEVIVFLILMVIFMVIFIFIIIAFIIFFSLFHVKCCNFYNNPG